MPAHPVRVYDQNHEHFADFDSWAAWDGFVAHHRYSECRVGRYHVALSIQIVPTIQYYAVELP